MIGSAVLVAAAGALIAVYGGVGIAQTVVAGTQPTVCGVDVGVTSSGKTVRLLGASEESLSAGDRVRLSSLCVVEVVGIDDTAAGSNDGSENDGAGARVQLRWRLW